MQPTTEQIVRERQKKKEKTATPNVAILQTCNDAIFAVTKNSVAIALIRLFSIRFQEVYIKTLVKTAGIFFKIEKCEKYEKFHLGI